MGLISPDVLNVKNQIKRILRPSIKRDEQSLYTFKNTDSRFDAVIIKGL